MMGRDNTVAGVCALLFALASNGASANIEPSSYDAKSIGAGTTGLAYLENPAALAINPANLVGIDRGGMSVNITPVFSVSQAPLAGPNSEVKSDLGFGPIPSLFGAVRIADHVVILDRQQIPLLTLQPPHLIQLLALWAMPIPT